MLAEVTDLSRCTGVIQSPRDRDSGWLCAYRPPPVISQEEVQEEKARLRAIDARPIKKVAEAKAHGGQYTFYVLRYDSTTAYTDIYMRVSQAQRHFLEFAWQSVLPTALPYDEV